jgi:hypothetical protein
MYPILILYGKMHVYICIYVFSLRKITEVSTVGVEREAKNLSMEFVAAAKLM